MDSNGTCNYLLSNMQRSGREFNDLLEEAKQLVCRERSNI